MPINSLFSAPSTRTDPSALPYPKVDSVDCPALYQLYNSLNSNGTSSPLFSEPTPSPSYSTLAPVLLWIDLENNDPKTAQHIRVKYPQLKMVFCPTYAEADAYMGEHGRDLENYEKFIIISRGYYVSEKKSCSDIAQLFSVDSYSKTRMAVYTRNREELRKRTPNLPDNVEVCEKREEIQTFIDKCFQK